MSNLLGYGVTELTTQILNFYHILLPSHHDILATPFFHIMLSTFYSVQNAPEPLIIQTLMTSVQLLLQYLPKDNDQHL